MRHVCFAAAQIDPAMFHNIQGDLLGLDNNFNWMWSKCEALQHSLRTSKTRLCTRKTKKWDNTVWPLAHKKPDHNSPDHLEHISVHFHTSVLSIDRLLAWHFLRLKKPRAWRGSDNWQDYHLKPFAIHAVCVFRRVIGEESWGRQHNWNKPRGEDDNRTQLWTLRSGARREIPPKYHSYKSINCMWSTPGIQEKEYKKHISRTLALFKRSNRDD